MGQQKQRNRRWVLASRPHGAPVPENFRLEEDDVATPGEFLLPCRQGWTENTRRN